MAKEKKGMDMLVDSNQEPLQPRQPVEASGEPAVSRNKRPAEIPLSELVDSGNTDELIVVSGSAQGSACVAQAEGGWEHVELEALEGEAEDEEERLIAEEETKED